MSAVPPPFTADSTVDDSNFPAVHDPRTRPASGLERLIASRERMRLLLEKPTPSAGERISRGLTGWFQRAREYLRRQPTVGVVVEAIESWWEQHPLHTAGAVAVDASRTFVKPVAQRNPLLLVLAAAGVGALLALLRPWRWLFKPAFFAGLLPQLLFRASRRLPLGHWASALVGLTSLTGRRPAPRHISTPRAASASMHGPPPL
jgi:hypothetical protein